jgi:hypothetical protein
MPAIVAILCILAIPAILTLLPLRVMVFMVFMPFAALTASMVFMAFLAVMGVMAIGSEMSHAVIGPRLSPGAASFDGSLNVNSVNPRNTIRARITPPDERFVRQLVRHTLS